MEPTDYEPLDLDEETETPAGYRTPFQVFHAANPTLYAAMVEHARQLKARGHTQVGIRYLFEHERYSQCRPALESADIFVALNNNFSPHYARLIEEQESDLEGFFRKRRTRDEMNSADPSQISMEFD